MKQIFFFFNGKKTHGVNECKIANYDLILTVLLLFALIFFKDPLQYNHPLIYGAMCFLCRWSVDITSTVCHTTSPDFMWPRNQKSCDFAALTITHHTAKFDGHTLWESVNVANHENYLTSWSKRILSRCRLMDHSLCKWRTVIEALFWVSVRHFGWMGHYFRWVAVGGALF